jgi:hypothetical protein
VAIPVTDISGVSRKAQQGEASFAELARALESLPELITIVPRSDFKRFLHDLDSAVRVKGVGNVRTSDAETPRIAGLQMSDGGFVPYAFTHPDWAREHAIGSGVVQAGEVLSSIQCSPRAFLQQCLARGDAGFVLDESTDHRLALDRAAMARLFALMTRVEFASLPVLHVVLHGGQVLLQKTRDGEGAQAFVYDSETAANQGLLAVRAKAPGVAIEPMPARALFEQLLSWGLTRLVVNPMLAMERTYLREDLQTMLQGLAPPPAPTPAPSSPAD